MTRFDGRLYRAINPRWAADPLSGQGAALFGGRFNRKGRPALYTSLRPGTAVGEVLLDGTLQPVMLVSYEAHVERVADARTLRLDLSGDDWREHARKGTLAPTQALAERLIAEGHQAPLVRSFAEGASEDALNLVLWSWSPDTLRVIDDEGRLPSPPSGSGP